jgi:hypothetical protein
MTSRAAKTGQMSGTIESGRNDGRPPPIRWEGAQLAGLTPQRARPTTGDRQDKLRLLRRRWPTLAGIATVPALLATGLFDDFVEGVVVAAVLYLAWGVLRRRPGQRRWVAWQVPGVLLLLDLGPGG